MGFQILICRGDGKSDIPPAAEWYYRKSDSDIKAYGFSAILFATLTCAANITAEGNNTAPRQYHSPQANRTAHFQCAKLQFSVYIKESLGVQLRDFLWME